jgi:hypothetical protein
LVTNIGLVDCFVLWIVWKSFIFDFVSIND